MSAMLKLEAGGKVDELWRRLNEADKVSGRHSLDVAFMTAEFVEYIGWSNRDKWIKKAKIHDIGKRQVMDKVKSEVVLQGHQSDVMKRGHVICGWNLLNIMGLRKYAFGALEHHERCDGSGYPFGKTREQLTLDGLVIGPIDHFCARIQENRPYRIIGEDPKKVAKEMKSSLNGGFDGEIMRMLYSFWEKSGYLDGKKPDVDINLSGLFLPDARVARVGR